MRNAASRTAILVCQGRAAADDRVAVGRFRDPVSIGLLDDGERAVVEQVRSGAVPDGLRQRLDYEFVRRCGLLMVPRTIVIDDAVREGAANQVVILGAGLDARAWRLDDLHGATVFEVDHPASQADKQRRLSGRAPVADAVRFVPVDFTRDDLASALDSAGHRPERATTWVWEGVVPYLTPGQVAGTAAALTGLSAPSSRLIVNYQSPSGRARVGRVVGQVVKRLAGAEDPWRDEPHRSHWTPGRLAALLAEHGFTVLADQDLQQAAQALDLDLGGDGLAGSLATTHVLVAERR